VTGVRALVPVVLATALSGCLFGPSREDELARVAKDWCQTIRASQVIPVYPLTEDLRPGDVFLVTRTIDADQDVYAEKGYLPLDLNLARLDVHGALKTSSSFQHPIGNALDGGIWPSSKDAWQTMSRVAFPSYSVSVDRLRLLPRQIEPIEHVPGSLERAPQRVQVRIESPIEMRGDRIGKRDHEHVQRSGERRVPVSAKEPDAHTGRLRRVGCWCGRGLRWRLRCIRGFRLGDGVTKNSPRCDRRERERADATLQHLSPPRASSHDPEPVTRKGTGFAAPG